MEFVETLKANAYFPHGFAMSLSAWRRFEAFSLEEGPSKGRIAAVRLLADRMNAAGDFHPPAPRAARAGELLIMGLLTEVLRHIAQTYCRDVSAGIMGRGLAWIRERHGEEASDGALHAFAEHFPAEPVRRGLLSPETFWEGESDRLPHREIIALETLLVAVMNGNPAVAVYRALHDDAPLRRASAYPALIAALNAFFDAQPPVPGTGMTLFPSLWAPILASPHSLTGQLEYVRQHWKALLPAELFEQLEIAWGIHQEETVWRGFGPGPLQALEFGHLQEQGYAEFEAFSVDREWMPNLVLIAKSVYVWLDQLSKQYQRPITRLDLIPGEELDRLAHWGFTGLWLIGIWERSEASRSIKRRMGNPEALASAYSLYDYEIAQDLGGEAAFRALADRASRRGIRLASDMVPNHMGLFSKWVIEHPDWFLQRPAPPYPSYRYTGPDLSLDSRVELQIEDGYWSRQDAAVVFKRTDRWTGETRYIYHGNDGTNMPWNDTAQLDFTQPAVRESVIQLILHVARLFPIIRFDAAMTLAKRHYQRLWFPKPGDAGAVPSRAEHGMSRGDFDRLFPVEFWREVVDRVAAEAPDTLLLAEAFWLMEGYFVRTLGMHRVYNSAFMNMLKMEDNAKYRQTIKNVLEFSPEVLQRFVNFMNNPDEDTASAQFGTGDKYFGVAVLLATMPGLPMFGHGQIEGFTEKYGMEYAKAYWEETPDAELTARHEREIFPLNRRRRVFSGSKHFALFDFTAPEGWVNENVFAYSNRAGTERALILYNNSIQGARGVIHTSTAINEGSVDEPRLTRFPLDAALALNTAETCYYIYRDQRSGLEYLRYARDIAHYGLHFDLAGYACAVLLDWREIHDLNHSWGQLHGMLGGRGVPSIEEEYQEMHLASLLEPFRRMFAPALIRAITGPGPQKAYAAPLRDTSRAFYDAIALWLGRDPVPDSVITTSEKELALIRRLSPAVRKGLAYPELASFLHGCMPKPADAAGSLTRVAVAWSLVRRIGEAAAPFPRNGFEPAATSGAWLREWNLVKQIGNSFQALDGDAWRASMDARLVRLCTVFSNALPALRGDPWAPILDQLFHDPDARVFLGMNHYGGRLWFRKEQLDRLLTALCYTRAIALWPLSEHDADDIMRCLEYRNILIEAAEDAGYDFHSFFDSLK